MLSLILWACCLAVGENDDAPKPQVAEKQIAERITALVHQLDADELAKRDAAEKELIELGPGALVVLPSQNERMPAEVAQRLARVRQILQERQAAAAAEPTLVTLSGEMKLSEALAAIEKQTGNRLVDHRKQFGEEVDDPTVKVGFEKAPFWQAFDDLLDQAQLTTYGYGGERGLFIVSRPAGQIARKDKASYSGPYRIAPLRFEAERNLQSPQSSVLKLWLEVAWEPRLQPIAIMQPLDAIQVVGSGDDELHVMGAEGTPEAQIGADTSSVELHIPMDLPARGVEQISKLKGKFSVLVPGQVETFQFDKPPVAKGAKRVEQRRAGVLVGLDRISKNQDLWEARVRVKFDNPAQALESHRGWIFNNEAYFIGKDGKPIPPGGYEQFAQAEDEIGIKYLFELENGTDGLAFVYKTPVTILTMPLEYELQDLDLP